VVAGENQQMKDQNGETIDLEALELVNFLHGSPPILL
jgi:hypothetical protein